MSIDHADTIRVDVAVPDFSFVEDRSARALMDRKERHLTALNRIDECRAALTRAAVLLTETLKNHHMVLTLGNGGSAAEAQHFAAELVGRFRRERRPYPVLALTTDSSIITAIANDYSYASVFSRQVEAFAGPGDLLIAFSTSGESENAIQAALAARERQVMVIAMTGERPGRLGRCADVVVQTPSDDTPTIQELHTLFTHVLCDVAESALMYLDEGSIA
jgi:D-sedoheptulose 7-phosphate isomerase